MIIRQYVTACPLRTAGPLQKHRYLSDKKLLRIHFSISTAKKTTEDKATAAPNSCIESGWVLKTEFMIGR